MLEENSEAGFNACDSDTLDLVTFMDALGVKLANKQGPWGLTSRFDEFTEGELLLLTNEPFRVWLRRVHNEIRRVSKGGYLSQTDVVAIEEIPDLLRYQSTTSEEHLQGLHLFGSMTPFQRIVLWANLAAEAITDRACLDGDIYLSLRRATDVLREGRKVSRAQHHHQIH